MDGSRPRLQLATATALALTLTLPASGAAASWERVDLSLPAEPYNLVAADFDGDGRPDLATVGRTSNQLFVALNRDDEDFEVVATIEGFTRPDALAATDFDLDGDLDLVVADAGADRMLWFTNDGAAAFTWAGRVAVGASPHAVVAADLDGDGDDDWLVSAFSGGTVSVVHNDGGEFEVTQTLEAAPGAERVAVADFDADGDLDFAVPSFSAGIVRRYDNDGAGRYAAAGSATVGARHHIPGAADVTGDGRRDLLVTSSGSAEVLVFEHGDVTADPLPTLVGVAPWDVAALDLDGDGDLDLLVADYAANQVHELINDGSGVFIRGAAHAVGAQPHQLVVADFDADGRLDVATANEGEPSITLLLAR